MTEPQVSERSIFQSAIDKASPQERAAHLDLACGDNLELRGEVEALLAAHDRLGSDASAVPGVTLDQLPASERSGAVIGPYKLLQKIGEGGMGTVFMAEQTHPVRRRVALKLIKAGMDSRQVIARFESERQALAMMDHVNIARALDAGTTQSGLPYFVMELVHGVPISKYCDDNQLTPRQRLELFIPVCRAIQHAHQKGIIHRDIKPSNVMITLYDGKPVPKVIDFGVAKATEQKLTERTLFTQYGTMVGTLEHMSPEQAEMSGLGIDTRSDIYSLGVLLYELLTGSTPLSQKRVREIAYGEILRLIKEEEPPRPSTRLSSSGDALASISAQRRMEPAKLARLVRGELDWIVMKALEKDRNRRYETASAFAADVERYLGDEAVQACPPSAWYLGRKFARRNKTGLGIAALILLFIVLLGGGVGWETRDRAARRAETGRLVRDSLASARSLLAENKPAQARQKLAEAKAQLGQERSGLSVLAGEVDALDAELARFDEFFALIDRARDAQTPGPIRMVLRGASSGDDTEAPPSASKRESRAGREAPYLLEALALYSVLTREDWGRSLDNGLLDGERVAQLHRAAYEALVMLSADMMNRRDDQRSGQMLSKESAARRALVYLQKAEGARAPTSILYRIRSDCWAALMNEDAARVDAKRADTIPATIALDHYVLGLKALDAGNKSEAVKEFEAALCLEPSDYWSLMALGVSLCDLGDGKQDAEAGMVAFTGCILRQPDHSTAYSNRALAYERLGRHQESFEDDCRAIALDPKNARAWGNRGLTYHRLGQFNNAIADLNHAIALDPTLASAWSNRGVVRNALGESAKAMDDLNRAIELDPGFSGAWEGRGTVNAKLRRRDEALADVSRAIELDPKDASNWADRGSVYTDFGEPDKGMSDLNKALELDPNLAQAWANRGAAYGHLKQWGKALAEINKAIELDPKAAMSWSNRGVVYKNLKQWDKAFADFNKAIELEPRLLGAWENRGATYSALKQWDKAFADTNKAIELDPTFAMAWCNRGSDYANLKQYDKAIADLNKAIELDPKLALAWCNRGGAYDNLKQWDKAIADLTKAIELDPKMADAWGFRGSAHSHMKQNDKAMADLNEAIKLNPENAESWNTRGMVWYAEGLHEKSIGDLDRAIELDPKYADAWSNRAAIYLAQGQTERALVDCSKAIELDPQNAMHWNNRGAAYSSSGRWDRAIADVSKAAELDPTYGDALKNLATLLATCPDAKLRDPARAVGLARNAVELAPKDVASLQVLGWALYRTGVWKESIESFRKSMSLQETPQGGDSGQWFGLALAYWRVGNKDEARKWYDQAVEWMEKNAPKDVSFLQYRAEAEKVLEIRNKATPK